MRTVSLAFLGVALKKRQFRYVPAAIIMTLWVYISGTLSRPADWLFPYLQAVGIAEKVLFILMTGALLWLCIRERNPLRFSLLPLTLTLTTAAVRIGWSVWFQSILSQPGNDAFEMVSLMGTVSGWKDLLLFLLTAALGIYHILRMY